MPGPGDALFLALAQAKARPSKALRAVEAGGQAAQDTLGGYFQGKDYQQKISQYKTLNTRLGDIFPSDSIPGGLTPDHTVGQLMQLAPILPYTRSPIADSIANEMAGSPSIAGSANPPVSSGTTALNTVQGAGTGNGANLPPGTSPTVSPSFKGMSYMDLQRYGPLLNDIRQGRQFQQGQVNENTRAQLSREQSARQHQESLDAEAGRARAGVAEKTVPLLSASAQLEGSLNKLENINSSPDNISIPFTGNLGARYAEKVPSTTSKWALNQKSAQSEADVAAGAIERAVEGRYNDEQMRRIRAAMIPTGNELGTPVATQKLNKFRVYVQQLKAGAIGQANAALDSIAGGSFNPNASAQPIGSSNSNDDPLGLFK